MKIRRDYQTLISFVGFIISENARRSIKIDDLTHTERAERLREK